MLNEILQNDVIRLMGGKLQEKGWYIDHTTGKYSCSGRVFHDPNRPWIYVNPNPGTPCSVYQTIVDSCGFIPDACLDCWKVVVTPKSLMDLMALLEWEQDFAKDRIGTGHFCKCGIEQRAWTHRNYGGYFYCKSKEHGIHRWEQVRKAMDQINPYIDVTLKRYCTEFEIKLGPSDEYSKPDESKFLEEHILNIVDVSSLGKASLQPDFVVSHIIGEWVQFAWDRGDPTAVVYNNGLPLYTPSVTYHPTAEEGN